MVLASREKTKPCEPQVNKLKIVGGGLHCQSASVILV